MITATPQARLDTSQTWGVALVSTLTPVVLSDLDSTLADTRHRANLARLDSADGADWIAYSKACWKDPAIVGPVTALRALGRLYPVHIVSGRNVEAKRETENWLDWFHIPYTTLRLREPGDILHNGHYKVAHIRYLRSQGLDPILMLEDHPGVADLVEAEGVPVLRVNCGYDDTVGVNFNHLTEADIKAGA